LSSDIVNGPVYAMTHVGSRIYLGGNFSWAGPKTGGGVPVADTDGLKAADSRVIEGTVGAAVADGTGGWVFGGSFFKTGGHFRNNVARMLPDGRINGTWNPNVKGGSVSELAVGGGAVYLGGTFTTVTGASRGGLAKVDLASGALQEWTPTVTGTVTALATSSDGARVFVGTTSGLSVLDASTGAALPGPAFNGAVHALTLSADGNRLFAGGAFTDVDGAARGNLAALNSATSAVEEWAPLADGEVSALAVGPGFVYVGGSFGNLAGVARMGFGRVGSDGSPSGWGPSSLTAAAGAALKVGAVAVSADGTKVFAGGNFVRSGSQPRQRAAAYSATTGALATWQPYVDADVKALAPAAGRVFVAGDFKMLNGRPAANIAAFDATTGQLDKGFTASADGIVRALAGTADGSRVFIGGDFGYVNGIRRKQLAAVDGASGALATTWQADTNGPIRALAVSGEKLFVGGPYTAIDGVTRSRLASVSATSGDVDPAFVPDINEGVRAIVVAPDGASVFIGGRFTRVDGLIRPGMAQLSATSGRASTFAPTAGGVVIAVELSPDGQRFYAADETNITYAYDYATKNAATWTLKTGGDVQTIAASATEVYVGGHFTQIPAYKISRPHMASVNASNGVPTAWNPRPDGRYWGVWAAEFVPGGLAIAGEFTAVGDEVNRTNFARFSGTT
jgi:hypothetical protein